MKLLPLLKEGYVSRSPINLKFFESDTPSLEINVVITRNDTLVESTIIFETVAKFEVIGLYFPEYYYRKYEILGNQNHLDVGFYQIFENESTTQKLFDPHNRLNLKWYAGNSPWGNLTRRLSYPFRNECQCVG